VWWSQHPCSISSISQVSIKRCQPDLHFANTFIIGTYSNLADPTSCLWRSQLAVACISQDWEYSTQQYVTAQLQLLRRARRCRSAKSRLQATQSGSGSSWLGESSDAATVRATARAGSWTRHAVSVRSRSSVPPVPFNDRKSPRSELTDYPQRRQSAWTYAAAATTRHRLSGASSVIWPSWT
jgi:hypothetical protein